MAPRVPLVLKDIQGYQRKVRRETQDSLDSEDRRVHLRTGEIHSRIKRLKSLEVRPEMMEKVVQKEKRVIQENAASLAPQAFP